MPYAPKNYASRNLPGFKKHKPPKKKTAARGYGGEWQVIQTKVLNERTWCETCLSLGTMTRASEVDHIRPLSKGGTHARENLQVLCGTCHRQKTARDNPNKLRSE